MCINNNFTVYRMQFSFMISHKFDKCLPAVIDWLIFIINLFLIPDFFLGRWWLQSRFAMNVLWCVHGPSEWFQVMFNSNLTSSNNIRSNLTFIFSVQHFHSSCSLRECFHFLPLYLLIYSSEINTFSPLQLCNCYTDQQLTLKTYDQLMK